MKCLFTFGVLFMYTGIVFSKDNYNILIGIPGTIKSLHNLISSVAYALADAGHTVTFFTPFNETKKHPNLIHFQTGQFEFPTTYKPENILFNHSTLSLLESASRTYRELVHAIWTNDEVWKLYERRHEFDAILTQSYANEFLFPMLTDFQGSFITVCTPGIEYLTISRLGHWLPVSVVSGVFAPYDENMSFWERSLNALSIFVLQSYLEIATKNILKTEMYKYHKDIKDITSYYERSSLTLINGHFAMDGPVPLLPNQVEIGTINAEKPKPLPQDLEEFMQGSGEVGVIYFSLGSFVLGKDIPQYIKEILVETFRHVPQKVLWKYEENDLDLPPNVMTRKWLPQQDILGHPKTRIFMSHCGNLGTQEAKFHGVPTLAVPVAFDQPRNAARLVRKGYGVLVNWNEVSTEKLLDAIHTLTKDSTYYDRMKNLSRILQDQKDTPAERAVWWIEYVIRHKGAPHLRYAGQRLSFFQYIMLDVIVFWFMVLLLIILTFVWTCKRIVRKCFGSSKLKHE